MLTPTTATTAFVAEGPPPIEIAGQTRRRDGLGAVHRAVQHLGHARGEHPGRHAASDGLPVGLQVVARRHDEELVLACGAIAEANRPWPKFAPMAYT